jgi:tetratricopeptide (TPR) repeat protein
MTFANGVKVTRLRRRGIAMSDVLKAGLLALTTQVACSLFQQRPFTCPQKGGAPWIEITSPHFVLRTDLDRDVAARTSAQLERTLGALSSRGFGLEKPPTIRIEVAYFRRQQEARMVLDQLGAGQIAWEGLHDLERMPFVCLYGDFTAKTRRTFQHELAHFLIHAYYGSVPPWLSEGLAKYLETLDFDGDEAIIGRAPSDFGFWVGDWTYGSGGREAIVYIPVRDAVPVAKLTRLRAEEFYNNKMLEVFTSAWDQANRQETTNYASAWNLVHLLVSEDAYRPAFEAFVKKLQQGVPSADAWSGTIGVLPADKLESDYRATLLPHLMKTRRSRYPASATPASVRELSDAEVHLLWAWLRDWSDADGRAAALSDIREAGTTVVLGLPEISLIQGSIALDRRHLDQAEHFLSRLEGSSDPRMLNALGWLTIELHSALGEVPVPFAERDLGPIAKRLLPVANKAAHFDLLAHYFNAMGDLDAAILHEKSAVQKNPRCASCLEFAAELRDKQGKPREALELAMLAAGALSEGVRSVKLDSAIVKYQKRVAQLESATDGHNSR